MFSVSPGSSGSAGSKGFEFEVIAVWASMPPPFPFQSGWIENQHDLCHEQTTLHSRIVLRLRSGETCPLSSLKIQSGQILTLANIELKQADVAAPREQFTVNRQRRLAGLRFDQTGRATRGEERNYIHQVGEGIQEIDIHQREFAGSYPRTRSEV